MQHAPLQATHPPDRMMAATGLSSRSRKRGRASMATELQSRRVASKKWGLASTGSTRSTSHTSRGLPLRRMISRSTLQRQF